MLNGPTRAGQRIAIGVAVALIALAALAAAYVRFGLVEATDVAAACLAYGQSGWQCSLRAASIVMFNAHALGTAALMIAALAFWRPRFFWLTLGLAVSAAGLVLYETGLSALAASLLILSLARSEGLPASAQS